MSSLAHPSVECIAALLCVCLTLLNLLALTPVQYSEHTSLFSDDSFIVNELLVRLRSTKTLFLSSSPLFFRLLVIPNSVIPNSLNCPVKAWPHYVATLNPVPTCPAFQIPSGASLIPKCLFLLIFNIAVSGCHVESITLTLHSLRRGATQACAAVKLPIAHMKTAGTWKSQPIYGYLSPDLVVVFATFLG